MGSVLERIVPNIASLVGTAIEQAQATALLMAVRLSRPPPVLAIDAAVAPVMSALLIWTSELLRSPGVPLTDLALGLTPLVGQHPAALPLPAVALKSCIRVAPAKVASGPNRVGTATLQKRDNPPLGRTVQPAVSAGTPYPTQSKISRLPIGGGGRLYAIQLARLAGGVDVLGRTIPQLDTVE